MSSPNARKTMRVVNPSPIPIRPRLDTLDVYRALSLALTGAANAADAAASAAHDAGDQGAAETARAVRDALRGAANEALVPRGGTRRPRCARCGIDCPTCTPSGNTLRTEPAQ